MRFRQPFLSSFVWVFSIHGDVFGLCGAQAEGTTTTTTTGVRDAESARRRERATGEMKIVDITCDDDDDDASDGQGCGMTTVKDGERADGACAGDANEVTVGGLTTAELRAELERLRAIHASVARSGDEALMAQASALAEPKYYAENRLEYTNGDAYVGETVENIRHGKGTHTCSTGDVYDGGWRDDKRHGFGTITYASGLMYEGDWVDDKTCGKGVCSYVNGDAYDGEWRDDHRWGWGVQVFANGDEYEGEWVDDIIEGQGLYTFADGSTYTGSMMSGGRVRGRYVTADGAVEYDGEWRGESRHGRGTFVAVGNMKYIGQWQDDQRHGRGKCEFRDGSSYDGEWHKDVFHGVGSWTTPTYTYTGEFVDGLKHGQGTTVFIGENAGEYRGEYVKGLEHGQGKRLYADGDVYRGEWRRGQRHGKGSCAYANGDQYQGEWRHDRRHGYGFCVFADGTKYRGEWEDDCWCQSTADPLFTAVFGPGCVSAVAGVPAALGIEARDELKNKRLSGGDVFTVKLTLVKDDDGDDNAPDVVEYGTVSDNGDGTYVAHYTCTVAGEYTCEVLIGADEHCGHSPYDVTVKATAPSAKHCVVVGDGVKRARAGERAQFAVCARDEFDNAVIDDVLDRLPLRVCITDMNGHDMATVDDGGVKIEDDGHGRLVASYVPARGGHYRLVVAAANDALIGASPYALRVFDEGDDENDGGACENIPEGSIAPTPNDLARDWEIIAKTDYSRDGDDFGWDSESDKEEETEAQRLARENPDVPIISNYEDMYKVGRLQKRIKEKRAAEQAAKLADMKAKLEVLELAKTSTLNAEAKSIDALDV